MKEHAVVKSGKLISSAKRKGKISQLEKIKGRLFRLREQARDVVRAIYSHFAILCCFVPGLDRARSESPSF